MDGGIEVTASHNPMDYNGMKAGAQRVRALSAAIPACATMQRLAEANDFPPVNESARGSYKQIDA